MSAVPVQIVRLLLRSRAGDPQQLQRQLGQVLELVDWTAVGVRAPAILCVRSLSRVAAGPPRLSAPRSEQTMRWQQALVRELSAHRARAARPAAGAVPASAEAILFTDRAELLACLARDVLGGELGQRWWWQLFAESADPYAFLVSSFCATPECVPGALARLAAFQSDLPARLAQTLGAQHCDKILSLILRRFALEDLLPGLPWSATHDRGPSSGSGPGTATAASSSPPAARGLSAADLFSAPVKLAPEGAARQYLPSAEPIALAATGARLPWEDPADRVDRRSPLSAQLLVGLGLLLHRAPHRLRSSQLQADLRYYCSDYGAAMLPQSPSGALPPDDTARLPLLPVSAQRLRAAQPTLQQESGGGDLRTWQLTPPGASSRVVAPALTPARAAGPGTAGDELHRQPETSGQPAQHDSHSPADTPSRPQHAPAHNPPTPKIASDAGGWVADSFAATDPDVVRIHTRLGGLFYLINLALYLELYGDFSTPRAPNIPLALWDFLTLLGERLLGDRPPDAVWGLLAELAACELDTPPGSGVEPPPQWRAASSWPATIQTLADWLSWVTELAVARLHRALGEADRDRMLQLLLCHDAEVRVTATHLDVFLALAELPLAIRYAGLDRNPGFIPAVGRTVTFHFEL